MRGLEDDDGLEGIVREGGIDEAAGAEAGSARTGAVTWSRWTSMGMSTRTRARAAGGGDAEGVVEDLREVFGVIDAEDGLGDGSGHRTDVGFLETELADGAIALHLMAIDLARDEDGGAGIEVAAANAGEEVGGARTAGGHRDAGRIAENATGGFGGESGSLLVAHADEGVLPEMWMESTRCVIMPPMSSKTAGTLRTARVSAM